MTKDEQLEALKLLLELNKRGFQTETFRIERCVLFGTDGSLDQLRRNIDFDDYRDVILSAEYEGDEHVRDMNFPFDSAECYSEDDVFPGAPDDLPF